MQPVVMHGVKQSGELVRLPCLEFDVAVHQVEEHLFDAYCPGILEMDTFATGRTVDEAVVKSTKMASAIVMDRLSYGQRTPENYRFRYIHEEAIVKPARGVYAR